MQANKANRTGRRLTSHQPRFHARRILWRCLIVITIGVLALSGMKHYLVSRRRSVLAAAPQIHLPSASTLRDGIPVYNTDINIEFSGPAEFFELVPDEVYQRENNTIMRKLFPGRLLGGDIIDAPNDQTLTLLLNRYQGTTENRWWIRSVSYKTTITYESDLDRGLYGLFGRPVDALCGHLVDRVRTGGPLGKDRFPMYSVGEFHAFIISPVTK
jgi:hypothetical protein